MTEEPKPIHDIVGQAIGSVRSLTEREREVLALIGHGYSLVEIARRLHRSVETVKSHRRSLAKKLGTRNRVLLAQVAMRLDSNSPNEGRTPELNVDTVTRDLLSEGLNSSAMPSIRCDSSLVVRAASQTACEWMNVESQHVVGQQLSDLPVLGQSSELFELCSSVAVSERSETRVIELSRRSRSVPFLVHVSPIVQERVGALSDLWLSFQDLSGLPGGTVGSRGTDAAVHTVTAESIKRESEGRRKAESRLREVVAGIGWSGGIGLFRQLVRHLCLALDVPHAVVCCKTSTDAADKRLSAIAGWSRGAPIELFDLDPTHGPCETALDGQTCHIAEGARTLFPNAPLVQRLNAESYLGLPLIGHDGSTLGILCILDDKPMPEAFEALPILRVFAARCAAELDRRNAEMALRDLTNRHKYLADLLPNVLFYCDSDGRCVYLSRLASEITGRDLTANLGADWVNFVHPDDRQRVIDTCAKAVAERKDIRSLVFRFVRPDGTVVPVVEGATCHFDADGKLQGWIGSAAPISDSELRQLNQLMRGTGSIG